MDIAELLAFAFKQNASDLHLSAGLPPLIRVDGDIKRINVDPLDDRTVHNMVYDIMNDKQQKDFEEFLECDFSFEIPNISRFRVNAFNQNRGPAAVFRTIPSKVLTLEQLNCPQVFKQISDQPRGIVLVTGPTGSGKSTTLAAMVNYINEAYHEHILTVEDPIEFVHTSKNCLINQREIGRDTLGFNNALRSALREDPDTILVGEMRDLETIRLALTAAETGHLVFGTLHTSSAAKTIDRIIDVFPAAEKDMVRAMLSESLRSVISQSLLKKIGGGRVAAHEIMIGTPAIRNPDSRRQGRANVFLDPDRPADGHADARSMPEGNGAATPGNRGRCPYHRCQQGTLRRRRGRRRERGGQTLMVFSDLLKLMTHKKASDLFITAGMAPAIKVDGKLTPVTRQALTPEQSRAFAYGIMNEDQRRQFEAHNECNFAIAPQDIGRFRVNVFMQQQRVGMVLRTINTEIPRLEDLHLPKALAELALTKRGLILFVGGTGSGKSTSLAAMVGYRNENSYGHIITIEDPIEYVHDHKNCLVTQREVGVDTESFETALKNTLRQAPDVILIGEIRARETMEYAIQFAETGHLCLSTLHANNANQALDRIINFFPEDKRNQLLMDLSLNLKAVVSQRLIPIKNGKGRVPAVEVMINSPLIADLIMEGKVPEIKELMSKSTEAGMQTFDQSLFSLFESDLISYDETLRNADSMNDLRLRIKLESKHAKTGELGDSLQNITYK